MLTNSTSVLPDGGNTHASRSRRRPDKLAPSGISDVVINLNVSVLFNAGYVFARARIHFDHFANLDEQRNFNHCASRQRSRFAASTCGIAFQAGIGIYDFQFNKVRRGHGDRLAVPQGHDALSLIQQPFRAVADRFGVSRQLFERFVVHEVPELTVVVQVSQVHIDNISTFSRVGGFEGFLYTSAGQQAAQFNACECLAFTRFNEFTGFNRIRFAVQHDFKTSTKIVAIVRCHKAL
ncbi:hypothetical protein CKO_03686 [Citrobacter koseri ATCC BAA-895]|uniref:Uncharacterized protein n=1 Tax=Citrobacter koseri (strain ATCC BAA-895 / CDC 4225-83 / SGSC4696) TaxID=290338 RepID=A8AMQ0_CITK8|nr:hypothetical protein CKO_03686 [Citrobacter koseri ATCC BAA-895]